MEFPQNKEFQKINYINNRNPPNEKFISNEKIIETNNNKNNHLLKKVKKKIQVPNPLLGQNIHNKKIINKNKLLKLNNKDLLTRAISYKTIENNDNKDIIFIKSYRNSINNKVDEPISPINVKSKKVLNENKLSKENFVINYTHNEMNQLFKNKDNNKYIKEINLNLNINNNTYENKHIKNILTLLSSKNKIMQRNMIPNLKQYNALNKKTNNSYYNTKSLKKHTYSSLASFNNSTVNSYNKNKFTSEKLLLENKNKSNIKNYFFNHLGKKPNLNLNNITIQTINNYTDRNYQTNRKKAITNFIKNNNKKLGSNKNCRSQKFTNLDSIANTISDIDSSRTNYYKNTNVTNSINSNYINKIKPKIKFNEKNYVKNTILDNKRNNQFFKDNKTSRDKLINQKINSLSKKEINVPKDNYNINKKLEPSKIKNMKIIIFENKLKNIKTKKLIKKDKILQLTNGNNTINNIPNFQKKILNNNSQNIGSQTSRINKTNINKTNKSNINFNYNNNNDTSERFASYKNLGESTNISFIKKLGSKVNYLNINLNNWNNINNTTICNNSQNNTQNISIPAHINTFNDNSIIFKKKLKNKFLKKQDVTFADKSLINSNNNIIILNNISMNNLNNISFDYLSKINKKKTNNSYKNFESLKKKLSSYVSKEKDYNKTKKNKELEKKREYYNNQKRIHKKKNNYKKNNRIKEKSLNEFNLEQMKIINNKKDLINRHILKRHNKINSSINFGNYIKKNVPNEYIHRHNNSNNFNIIINTNKINNIPNIINKNYSTSNNKPIDNIIKNLKETIQKGKERSKMKSEQISPKKISNININSFSKNNNNNILNPIKTLRHSHKIKKKIIKDYNKEKNLVTEFNNYFKIKKKIKKNCLSDLNKKIIDDIKDNKNDSISIVSDKSKEKDNIKKNFKSFSKNERITDKNGKIKIIKKKKQTLLNTLNTLNESLGKNKTHIKKAFTDTFSFTEIDTINTTINDNTKNTNPQFAEEYTTDIIESLLEEEDFYFNKKKYIDPFYLENEDSELTPEMRTIAVDWLVLIHSKIFKFDENTLFLAIQIFDRYLSKVDLTAEKTELLLYTSFMIASKHNEIDYVNMQETLKLSQDKFKKEEIIRMESEILRRLNFEILIPTMCEFFILFASYLHLSKKKINQGLYILNIILVDFHMLKYPNFLLAFAVVKLVAKSEEKNLMELIENILKEKKLEKFLNMFKKDGFEKICKKIKLLYNAFMETKYKNIQEKFAEKEFNCVSKFLSI